MMHINLVTVDATEKLSCSFDIRNIKTTDRHGKKEEKIQAVATFIKDGEEICKIHNIGNFKECTKLLDRNFAIEKAKKLLKL